ncbi:hypothetical protein F4803DRAFT_54559 [Xylaria telfairii]|nr:hypothetical protein F4803DRAFT_54559 [Xylaria telfairii]
MSLWGGALRLLAKDKKARKRAIQTAIEYVDKVHPIVQTIQAEYGTYNLKKMLDDAGNAADDMDDGITKALDVAKKVKELAVAFVPSMQVMGQSFADSAKIFTCFSSIATTAGIGANIVLAYQGLKVLQLIDAHLKSMATSLAAQTALIAQKDFPQYVYDMIWERITQTSLDGVYDHWFFVYHPDNDWYPGFFHILKSKPIGPEFCGYTNQIDTAFAFMLAARARIGKKERKARREGRTVRPTKLHLLIPAYQPLLILEALKIPDEIGDFVMEGRIHSNREFVWLNLPKDQRHYVQDIGQFDPPVQGWFGWAMSGIGLADMPPKLGQPRILGTMQGSTTSNQGHPDLQDDSEGEKDEAHDATPLQHQYTRNRRRRRRRGKGE